MVDLSRDDVESILDQIDQIGLDAFMQEHPQFGSPKRFWFESAGRPGIYPTKPVAAVALGWPDINGGYGRHDSACRVLERAGYRIIDKGATPESSVSQLIAQMDDAAEGVLRTDAYALVRQRIGQELFRRSLIDLWDGACALTGVTDAVLLRASHMKPWSECVSDEERLNQYNGILLSAL